MDFASGYNQVPVTEKDRPKTAFCTLFGLFEWNRMPFGLCNAPSTFQRLMQQLFGDQQGQSLPLYLDDIVFFSSTVEQHLERLEMVLDPSKVAVVANWQPPTTVSELWSFLGFASYNCRLVEGFAKLAAPLHRLVAELGGTRSKKKAELGFIGNWTEECHRSFEALKTKLTMTPVLAYADFSLPFILEVDASHSGLGIVLSQDQGGKVRPIAYASRGLRPTEHNMLNYSSVKLEFLGLKWDMTEKFREYLLGHKCWDHLVEKDGVLYHQVFRPDGAEAVLQLLLPAKVLTQVHQEHGHQGVERTLELLWPQCYWPGMSSEVAHWCQACERCQVAKDTQPTARNFIGHLLASRPNEILAIDYTVLEPAHNGMENVLIMTDIFSKYTLAVPTRDQCASTVAQVLVAEWFSKFGVPARIHSDQGHNSESSLILFSVLE
eukprot:superscaffoldBa00010639_g24814